MRPPPAHGSAPIPRERDRGIGRSVPTRPDSGIEFELDSRGSQSRQYGPLAHFQGQCCRDAGSTTSRDDEGTGRNAGTSRKCRVEGSAPPRGRAGPTNRPPSTSPCCCQLLLWTIRYGWHSKRRTVCKATRQHGATAQSFSSEDSRSAGRPRHTSVACSKPACLRICCADGTHADGCAAAVGGTLCNVCIAAGWVFLTAAQSGAIVSCWAVACGTARKAPSRLRATGPRTTT